MDWQIVAIEVLFSGTAIGLGVWQLVSIRRERRRDASRLRAAAERRSPDRLRSPDHGPIDPPPGGAR
ncbi:hypothetical protein GJ689_22955 [Rhodoplanes serenus]|uniref:Uncharacterized protein n=1 Tax=Rhodoplanes serenus TaxID=200615 RepID=A0A9X4XUB6_9BRAD|nr:hypothetical protein [Rhodoplanes serenus]MTW19061.1 hypothetical protein [Rhodoplanes serenus]